MKTFALIFRLDATEKPTPAQKKEYMQQWMAWLNDIAATGQLAEGGNHFSAEGRVLKPNNGIIETPYPDGQSAVAGYLLILAEDLEGATIIARKCPILNGTGNSVEIRETATPGA